MLRQVLFLVCALFMHASVLAAKENALLSFEVEGVDGPLKDNVSAHLSNVVGQATSDALVTHIEKQTKKALNALGYYHADINVLLSPKEQGHQALIEITRGKPTRITQLSITISPDAPILEPFLQSLRLKEGQVLDHSVYQGDKSALDSHLLSLGYFDARWQKARLEVDLATHSARITWQLNLGERYQFGDVTLSGKARYEATLKTLMPFQRGDFFNQNALMRFNMALNSTPYFDSVFVSPLLNERKNGEVPISVTLTPKPANSFEVGGGFSTDLGARGRFKWSKPYVTDAGHYFDLDLNVAQKAQEATFSYTVPMADPVKDVLRYVAGLQNERNDDLNSESNKGTVQVQRQWQWQAERVLTAYLKYEDEDYRLEQDARRTTMVLPGVSLAKKSVQGGTTPTQGYHWMIGVEGGHDGLLSSTSLLKLHGRAAWLHTFAKRHLVFARTQFGAIWADDIEDVPLSMRFFAGGDQSVRAYKYETISPVKDGDATGGKYLASGTLEYNYQINDTWRVAVFTDAAWVTNQLEPANFKDEVAYGPGWGVRYLTPIGPIRFDHAFALSKDSKSTRLSITIGPEL